eukprot:TRINITY_DN13323_c0_g3_i1.p1 TRINITY_DN13323_c0_g3~~TRINITY_DN13323_c0_g3_i1.p1  ORF type:complete len:626 (-),score=72.28 TRINITY_DN13323_c0_g3_i1:183-2060(-)
MKTIYVVCLIFLGSSSLVSALVAQSKARISDDNELPNLMPATSTTKPTTLPHLTRLDIKAGILRCSYSNIGAGFFMYSSVPVNERWRLDKAQSTFRRHTAYNTVCVRFHKGSWQFDSNWGSERDRMSNQSWHNFAVRGDDIGIARIDFTKDKVTTLRKKKFRYQGLNMGWSHGSTKISLKKKSKYGNVFRVKGTGVYAWPDRFVHIPTTPKPPRPIQPANRFEAIGGSMRCTDRDTGRTFVMFTNTSVNERWNNDTIQDDFRIHSAKSFVCVRWKNLKWQYDTNWRHESDRTMHHSWHDFKPQKTDTVVAAVDYAKGKVEDMKGVNFYHGGLRIGYGDGDLEFFRNQNATGAREAGSWRITGSWILAWNDDPPPIQKPHPGLVIERTPMVKIGGTSHRFRCYDANRTNGFIMFSPRPLAIRLNSTTSVMKKGGPTKEQFKRGMHAGFTCVRFKDHRWQFDAYWTDNHSWHTFIPNITDVIVAAVNYTNDQVSLTKGSNVKYSGMQMGFAGGDIKIQSLPTRNGKGRLYNIIGSHLMTYVNTSMAVPPPFMVPKATTTTTTAKPTTTSGIPKPFFTTTTTTTAGTTPRPSIFAVALAAANAGKSHSDGESQDANDSGDDTIEEVEE